LIYHKIWYR